MQVSVRHKVFALLFAPVFGFLPFQYRNFNVPLTVATASGAVGYVAFAMMNTSRTGPVLFVVVALLGVSQIGAIVSSLSLVSGFVSEDLLLAQDSAVVRSAAAEDHEETSPLIDRAAKSHNYEDLKGAIAGIYSFFGSLAILVLTKLGGLLFDLLGPGSPFYLLALFNIALLFAVDPGIGSANSGNPLAEVRLVREVPVAIAAHQDWKTTKGDNVANGWGW
ncbi:MAG: hypothetical protein Q9207_003626 [Kuettlingeria erythrocarpa]